MSRPVTPRRQRVLSHLAAIQREDGILHGRQCQVCAWVLAQPLAEQIELAATAGRINEAAPADVARR